MSQDAILWQVLEMWRGNGKAIPAGRIEPLRAASIKGFRVLNPTGPRRGPCNADWSIQVNLPVTWEQSQSALVITAKRDRPLVGQ